MLKRNHRLPSSIRLSHAKLIRFPLFTVKYQPSVQAVSRIGVVISKKISPSAVERNHLKRLVTTYFHEALASWHHPYDLLIILHPQASKVQPDVFTKSLLENITKLAL